MKTLRLTPILFAMWTLTFGFCACSDDDEPEVEPTQEAFFDIEKHGYEISSEAQTIEVHIHTNIKVNQNVSEDARAWISIVGFQQTEEYLIYLLSVKENTGSEERTGIVVFTPTAETMITPKSRIGANTIAITQAGTEP